MPAGEQGAEEPQGKTWDPVATAGGWDREGPAIRSQRRTLCGEGTQAVGATPGRGSGFAVTSWQPTLWLGSKVGCGCRANRPACQGRERDGPGTLIQGGLRGEDTGAW